MREQCIWGFKGTRTFYLLCLMDRTRVFFLILFFKLYISTMFTFCTHFLL